MSCCKDLDTVVKQGDILQAPESIDAGDLYIGTDDAKWKLHYCPFCGEDLTFAKWMDDKLQRQNEAL